MRLIRLATNYSAYLTNFYASHIDLEEQDYWSQYQTLMADSFGWADFWTHALRKFECEVWEPVGNAEPMQKRWADENGVRYRKKHWLTDIICAQVKHFKPEIVLTTDYNTYGSDFLENLRRICPSIRYIVGWCGAPFSNPVAFNAFDLILSNIPGLVEYFRQNGHRCEHVFHAFEPRILQKINKNTANSIDFSFVGSIVKYHNHHRQREELLKEIVRAEDINIYANIKKPTRKDIYLLLLRRILFYMVRKAKCFSNEKLTFKSIPTLHRYMQMSDSSELINHIDKFIADRARPAVFGISMFQKLFDSKITLNTHIDISLGHASNMRLYEATGVGTCLLTEQQPNLHQMFEPDVEVVTYGSSAECIEKVNFLLNHDKERNAIAKAGQERTLRDHTFDQRAEQLHEILCNLTKTMAS
jgi:spore maturation protein CgeB